MELFVERLMKQYSFKLLFKHFVTVVIFRVSLLRVPRIFAQ